MKDEPDRCHVCGFYENDPEPDTGDECRVCGRLLEVRP